MEKFITLLAGALEIQPGDLKPETVLDGMDAWDSLALISFMSVVEKEYGKVVSVEELSEAVTVQDLFNLTESA